MDGRGLPGAPAARIVIRPEDLQGAARLLTRVADPRAAVCLAAVAGCCARTSPNSGSPRTAAPAAGRDDRGGPLRARGARTLAAEVIADRPPCQVAAGTGGPVLAEPVQRGRQDRRRAARRAGGARSRTSTRRAAPARRCSPPGRAGDRARRPGARSSARQARDRPADGRGEPARPGARARARPRGRSAHRRATSRSAVIDLDHSRPRRRRTATPTGDLLAAQRRPRLARAPARRRPLARYGGEEFVVVLPERRRAPPRRCARSTACAVRRRGVTASAGVALWDGREPRGAPRPPRRRRALRGRAQRRATARSSPRRSEPLLSPVARERVAR